MVLLHPQILLPEKDARAFGYAPSRNNLRALRRVDDCLRANGVQQLALKGQKLTLSQKIALISSMGELWRLANDVTELRHPWPLVQSQCLILVAALIVYERYKFPTRLKMVCVANDHNPIPIALLAAARARNVATCYVQHAPVTKHFPTLNCDVSLLYDGASRMAYETGAGERGETSSGTVLIFSPFGERFRHPKLSHGPLAVGLCLSYLPNLKTLEALLISLTKHSAVRHVKLRRHPRCHADLSILKSLPGVIEQPLGEPAKSFFSQVDLALVPNSGVAIEALHLGCPSFYVRDTDFLVDDYYGFVREGIVPRFIEDFLEDRDRANMEFSEEWASRFSEYDQTVNVDPNIACNQIALTIADHVSRSACELQ
jgi:hypothetical protein|tara:strand:+ start:13972 stop:15087 length:1116 start_codon:yes stop_codon:yes gene_type:complete